jgi:colanic acid biosynthesis glycosyl transferase WcaI
MKILILTQWYPPEPQRLLLELALSLRDAGHEVTVLTGFPNFPAGELYPGYRLRFYQREQIEGVPVIRVPLYPDHSRSAMKRALNIVSFAVAAAVLGPWLTPKVDVIHVIHPPLTIGLPAWVLSRLKRVPFVYEIQDMWPETLRSTGLVRSDRVLGCIGRLAKWVYRRAAAIREISPGFRDNLVAKGVPAEKIRVISNWVDTDFYRPLKPEPQLAERLALAGRFNIMFAGMMGPAQGLETVVEAAALLGDLPDVQFVLVGDGNDLPRLKQLAEQRNLTNVRFLGRFPPEDMPGLYALADVLLIHLRDDPLFRITIPHKTFAYMASEKPVLAAVEGDVADVIRSAQAGLTCPSGNPAALADAARRFHAMSPVERNAMAANGRSAACELFSRAVIAKQLVEMHQAVVDRRRKSY